MSTWPLWTAVAAGGALGAGLRSAIQMALTRRRFSPDRARRATLLVNASGAATLGAALQIDGSVWAQLALGTGFCGALTTFSTAMADTHRLAAAQRWQPAAGLAAAHLGLSVGAFAAGSELVRRLVG